MQVGSLSLFIGPMYSMKTTQLIKSIKNYNSSERLIVKHIADDRYGSGNQYIATHDGTNIPSLSYQTLEEFVSDNINHLVNKKIKAVFIDEGQFFGDLYNSVYDLVNLYHKNVYVAGLDGDYKRNQFGDILKLIPEADYITKLTAKCYICNNPAPFTKRLNNENDNQIIVGGNELYQPSCREHHTN